jgi:hypothetical protein
MYITITNYVNYNEKNSPAIAPKPWKPFLELPLNGLIMLFMSSIFNVPVARLPLGKLREFG